MEGGDEGEEEEETMDGWNRCGLKSVRDPFYRDAWESGHV